MADSSDTSGMVTGTIRTALGAGALFLQGFTAVERMGEPFRIVCEVVSPARIDFSPQLGTGVSLSVDGDGLTGRSFHGLLMEASEVTEGDGAFHYALVLRPWLSLLALNRRSKIFQHLSARDIIAKVFQNANIDPSRWRAEWRSRGTLKREYCVQYNESDFDFVSRLMEEEGIYYYFAHSQNQHVMTLCDGPASHTGFAGGDVSLNDESGAIGPCLWSLTQHVKPTPTLSSSRDTHFRKFGDVFDASSAATSASQVTAETYAYPGGHSYLTDDGATTGDDYAKLRLLAARAEKTRYVAEGEVFAVPVGSVVKVVPVQGAHTSPRGPVKMLVTGAVHSFGGQKALAHGADEGLVRRLSLEGTPSTDTWLPLPRTPKPVAHGPQVGTVVGAQGEVVDVDALGRVKVQFPWDRDGKGDEGSSCWIRVSQGWADKGFGHLILPRIGQEVIVDYLEGDMDRPIITGSVFNASNTVPYGLPGEKTKSTWKSHTIGQVGQAYDNAVDPPKSGDFGMNEIRFEDKSGAEEVYMHAQRYFNAWYRLDETRTTGRNAKVQVGYNRDVTVFHNESFTCRDGDESHTVKTGKRTTQIHGDDALTVTDGDRSVTVSKGGQKTEVSQGALTTTVKQGDVALKAELGKVAYEAMQSIELKVGGNSIKIDQGGVTINGTLVQVTGTTTNIQGATTAIKGGLVTIN